MLKKIILKFVNVFDKCTICCQGIAYDTLVSSGGFLRKEWVCDSCGESCTDDEQNRLNNNLKYFQWPGL